MKPRTLCSNQFRLFERIEDRSYSSDLNPIEMAFAKPALSEAEGLKALLRRRAVRTIDALWRAIGDICDIF